QTARISQQVPRPPRGGALLEEGLDRREGVRAPAQGAARPGRQGRQGGHRVHHRRRAGPGPLAAAVSGRRYVFRVPRFRMSSRPLLRAAPASVLLLAAFSSSGDRGSGARRTPVVQAVERSKAAVVNINAQEVVRARTAEDPFEAFFGRFRYRDEVRASLGSGFVFDAAGYVLTNYHVVARGSRIQVGFDDGSDYTAKVVGTDPGGDLAVLKIQGDKKFPAMPLGSSGDLMLGEPVIAIGNPFGLNQSVSVGVVSALHRTVRADNRSYYDFVQTDASINPGNSGGPLINADGEVIGVCSAIYANAQGIGFAIPIDRALRVARELVKSGELAASFWGFDASTAEGKPGARVDSVESGSPAGHAGLRRGDLVVNVDRSPVRDVDELRFLL